MSDKIIGLDHLNKWAIVLAVGLIFINECFPYAILFHEYGEDETIPGPP
jgi:hypothetical protein